MFRNYLKIAFRNLWRHKAFSFLNILGLTVGITAFFLILLYVSFELSFDNFHTKGNRIYRLVCDIKTPTETIKGSITSWPMAPNIKNDFPEVESFVRLKTASILVRKGNVKFQEDNTVFADSAFFHVFDFKMLRGNPQTALKEPFSVVFTKTAAKKYFGNANPIGQTLLLSNDDNPAVVTGVMQDIPENSQIQADMLVSMSTITEKYSTRIDSAWGNFGAISYLLLKPGSNPNTLQSKFRAFLENRIGSQMQKGQMFYSLFLEPLKSVHLYSTRDGSKTGNITKVYIFSIIGLFILLIACINFVNLTTARSAERAKEVGIRKVAGALKKQLTGQFIGESIILCLIAFILSVAFSAFLIPLFNQLSGMTVSHGLFSHPFYLLLLFLTAIMIGLLAGIYPALVLSSFKPVAVLKGRFTTGVKGILLRKGLVVTQFTISTALIIGTIVVYAQMNYMRSRDLGFNKDQKLILDTHGDPGKDAFKQSIASLPGVISTAMASSVPGSPNPAAYSEIENQKGEMQIANLDLYFVDFDYIPQYRIKMIAGRAFSRDFATDTTQAMIMNEAAVKMFGYSSPQQIIGRHFKQWGREGKIIGVVKDFHFRSLQENIKPLTMRIEPGGCNLVSINISAKNLPATLSAIESRWKTFIPNRPFSYYFVDEAFDKQYRSEDRFGRLFLVFAILAIFISCLGLLGLASYSTLQRTKEIGIRKTLGASVGNIVGLLSKDFLTLVFISFFIAAPVAWYFMHHWLENFAYRIQINWWVFVTAGILALLIALITVSWQAVRAAVANPVESLRTE